MVGTTRAHDSPKMALLLVAYVRLAARCRKSASFSPKSALLGFMIHCAPNSSMILSAFFHFDLEASRNRTLRAIS
jgi:hypothetical protein